LEDGAQGEGRQAGGDRATFRKLSFL
jgi:hypothetical protein